ncbi:hypothetical protein CHS0354_011516 [Potamilus streckersoni]|uniref:Zinc transporter ZIP14 n=1 Tax=Potamilus streckersoni TaxID=2493646 RepID=A0AAE0SLH0_9BIVA|nr:hypothetical protein CHS0354_011516 [Potamilus streckersoni]
MDIRLTLVYVLFTVKLNYVYLNEDLHIPDQPPDIKLIQSWYIKRLRTNFQQNITITIATLDKLFTKLSLNTTNSKFCNCVNDTGCSYTEECFLTKCLSPDAMLEASGILPPKQNISDTELTTLSYILMHQLTNPVCRVDGSQTGDMQLDPRRHPKSSEAWGFGILFVTIICLGSLMGIFVLPFMKKKVYKKILIFMVALAVGTLAGSALLFLIPEAFGMVTSEVTHESYIWKSLVIIGGIYLFFMIERILKMVLNWREEKQHMKSVKKNSRNEVYSSFNERTPVSTVAKYKDTGSLPANNSYASGTSLVNGTEESSLNETNTTETVSTEDSNQNEVMNGKINGHSHASFQPTVAPVAWMVIFGDGVHNFIDGLSIGAAFTESILAGISVSLAVICEELPHELGDLAIMLNSGMMLKKALLYNFMSACMCYLGLILGILLGENTMAHDWILGLAGGMFLYISLVDMLPEMNSEWESEENKKTIGQMLMLVLQNLGMLLGFGIMLVLAVYSKDIALIDPF